MDLNIVGVEEPSSSPAEFCELGSSLLFVASTPALRRELWRHDFATGATTLVRDVNPGPNGSDPADLVEFAGAVWFVADDGVHGRELWRSDGTAAGTVLVRDIQPGVGGASIRELTPVGNQLFFVATTANHGTELWCSDGTSAGTRLVTDLAVGGTSSFPAALTAFGARVVFRAIGAGLGSEPWISDGTAVGTVPIADLVPGPGGSFPSGFGTLGNVLLFGASGQLHRSLGTAATTVALGAPAPTLMRVDGALAFYTTATSVWATDGTAANTSRLADVASSPQQIVQLEATGGRAFVFVNGGVQPQGLLFGAGLAGGATMLHSQQATFVPGAVVTGGRVWFDGVRTGVRRLFATDGTVAGTQPVAGLYPDDGIAPESLAAIAGNRVVFSGSHQHYGREPFVSDGTTSGTRMLANVAVTTANRSSNAEQFVDLAGITYFAADPDTMGSILWRTDGTAAGTWPVVPLGLTTPRQLSGLSVFGTRIVFAARTPADGRELWISDGTAAGTTLLLDLNPGPSSSSPWTMVAGDRLYVFGYEPLSIGLWVSDGSPANTTRVRGFQQMPTQVAAFGRSLILTHDDGVAGFEPWLVRGDTGQLVQLADMTPGPDSGFPHTYVVFGDRCYFVQSSSVASAIWSTDGTPAGTVPFLDLAPGSQDFYGHFRVAGNRLFFGAQDLVHGYELWVTDGTPSGTHLVVDLEPGSGGPGLDSIGSYGARLLFRVNLGLSGEATWCSDGTAAGTYFLTDAVAFDLVDDGRYGWFSRWRNDTGYELWRTDGTAAGTALFADLLPGIEGATPRELTLGGGRLFFRAGEPQHGTEPWVLPLGASVQPVGSGCFAAGTAPRLVATAPVLGTTMTVRGENGPAAGLACTLFGFPSTTPFRFPGGSCDLWLAQPFEVLQFSALAQGGFALSLTLPGSSAFQGLQLRLQSLLFPNGALVGVESTNALNLGFGL